MKFIHAIGAAALTALLGSFATAQAGQIYVAAAEDGSALAAVPQLGVNGNIVYAGATSDYNFNGSAMGFPQLPQPVLDTASIDVQQTGTGQHTLTIYITQTGLTYPQAWNNFFVGFTSNTWTGNVIAVTEKLLIDPNNGLFGGTETASFTFTAPLGSVGAVSNMINLSGPFSETVKYNIVTNGYRAGSNNTVDVGIPEPLSLSLLGSGLIGLGLLRRKTI